jgi:hypothetical protein
MEQHDFFKKIELLEQKVEALEKSRPAGFRAYLKQAFMKTHVIAGVLIAAVFTSFVIYAATVSKPYTFVDGTTISAGEVNSTFDTLYNLVNGNLNDDNISGISGSKINAGTVNSDRLPIKKLVVTINAVTPSNAANEVTTEFGSNYRIATVWEAMTIISSMKTSLPTNVYFWVTGGSTQDMSTTESRYMVAAPTGGVWGNAGAYCQSGYHLAVFSPNTSLQPFIYCVQDVFPYQVVAIEK